MVQHQRLGCGQPLCSSSMIGAPDSMRAKIPTHTLLVGSSSQDADADAYLTCDAIRRCDLQEGCNLLLKLYIAPSGSKPLNQNAVQATPVSKKW